MMNGKGKVVRPDLMAMYYKRFPKGSPSCMRNGEDVCREMPKGLRLIMGYNMSTNDKSHAAQYRCIGGAGGDSPVLFPTIAQAAATCQMDQQLTMVLDAQICWDGVHLDSADHRSHMAYPVPDDSGQAPCPITHKYMIPFLHMAINYTV